MKLSPFWMTFFSQEIESTNDNPRLTFETIVTRVYRCMSESFHLPWSRVLELSRQAPYLMDSNLHQYLPQNLDSTFQKCHFGQATLRGTYFGSRQCAILGFDQIDLHSTPNQISQNSV
ncbi:hypothetical protein TNCV_12791 [Trichonephila clavipes]|nr:hypothetical protein TNCV_12791 [Trichonephila clavipes]